MTTPRHIADKAEFYAKSLKLELGNRLRQWRWPEFETAVVDNDPAIPEIVGVRHLSNAFVSARMPKVDAFYFALPYKDQVIFDEAVNDSDITIQGELLADEQGLYLRYSHLQCHQRVLWQIEKNGLRGLKRYQYPHNLAWYREQMRSGIPIVQHERGLRASAILKQYFCADGWDCLNALLAEYANPVIEFACFRRPIGVLRWRVIFWEIRTKY